MRVVFCIYNFRKEMIALQPWLTFLHIGKALFERGHEVYVFTDVANPAKIDGFTTIHVVSLRGSNKLKLINTINLISPDTLVFLPTPLNLFTSGWLHAIQNCRCVAFTSYPFYTPVELLLAWQKVEFRHIKAYLRHLLIPGMLWRSSFCRQFSAVISQSQSTFERLSAVLNHRIPLHVIPPGIDLSNWPIRSIAPKLPLKLLYIGTASKIRGFDVLLDAMAYIKNIPAHLNVLARGADDSDLDHIHSAVKRRDLGKRVDVSGGWLQHSELLAKIHTASAVVLPFVLVPSDLPVSVIEAIACGTPVIGSRIDGIPSSIGRAGTVVKQANSHSLARIFMRMNDNPNLLNKWHAGCVEQRNQMMDWDSVAGKWEKVLFNS